MFILLLTMRKAVVPQYWVAEAKIQVSNIAFACPYDEVKEGNHTYRVFRPDFLKDGKVMWHPASKVRGWLKEQVKTIKPSATDLISYGIKTIGDMVEIAGVSELEGNPSFPEKDKAEYRVANGMPFPYKETITVKDGNRTRSTFAFHYVLPKEVEFVVKIIGFARNISPESIEEIMRKIGPFTGLGDRHSQGYGHFKIKEFKVLDRGVINF